jgi:hypothetical protein
MGNGNDKTETSTSAYVGCAQQQQLSAWKQETGSQKPET